MSGTCGGLYDDETLSVLFICWGGPLGDLGLQMSGICGVCICSFHLLGRPSRRPGASDVGDMWGLYLFFLSGVGRGEGGEGEEKRSGS